MELPKLMPFQEFPFNGDTFIEQEILALKKHFAIHTAVETGTCMGSTTMFLSRHFEKTISIEIDAEFAKIAAERIKKEVQQEDLKNLSLYVGDSSSMLGPILKSRIISDKRGLGGVLFFLDAHWQENCPLESELDAIAEAIISPVVIAIHDFVVPGSNLGFDSYAGQAFTFEWLKPKFDKIYGENNYSYHYNSDEKSANAKRGIIYVYPNRDANGNWVFPIGYNKHGMEYVIANAQQGSLFPDNPPESKDAGQNAITPESTPEAAENNEIVFEKPKRLSGLSLVINYYQDKNPVRQKELDDTLLENISNPHIDAIYLLVQNAKDVDSSTLSVPKIHTVEGFSNRPTYRQIFYIMNELRTQESEIMILANADIYITETVAVYLKRHMKTPLCFALSPWDKLADGSYRQGKIDIGQTTETTKHDSQDVWVFKGSIRPIDNCNFTMGRPGCDNAIAKCIQDAGYIICNPSNDIRPVHNHISGVRNYITTPVGQGENLDRVNQPYLMLPPIGIPQIPFVEDTVVAAKNWIDDIPKSGTGNSQFHEDSIIDHIFKHIGSPTRFYVDLGAGAYTGSTMSNTRSLKNAGWIGFGVDASAQPHDSSIIKWFIKPENVVELLRKQNTPLDFDFLNLDIDSSDFWVLLNILGAGFRPRLICSEFNGTLDPYVSKVLLYEDGYTWDKTNKYGYSFAAGKKLLNQYGYEIIHNLNNVNLFAVKKELVGGLDFDVQANRDTYHPINQNAVWTAY